MPKHVHCSTAETVQYSNVVDVFHIQRNIRTNITGRPRTKAGRRLRVLSLALTKIAAREASVIWVLALNAWHEDNKAFLSERTYRGTP